MTNNIVPPARPHSENYFTEKHFILTGETKRTDAVGNIYVHKNDPKVINKGIRITNVRHAQGGFFPLLAESNYNERKFDNKSYNYEAKIHHGTRPMHQTTFELGYQKYQNDYMTHNNFVNYGKKIPFFNRKNFELWFLF